MSFRVGNNCRSAVFPPADHANAPEISNSKANLWKLRKLCVWRCLRWQLPHTDIIDRFWLFGCSGNEWRGWCAFSIFHFHFFWKRRSGGSTGFGPSMVMLRQRVTCGNYFLSGIAATNLNDGFMARFWQSTWTQLEARSPSANIQTVAVTTASLKAATNLVNEKERSDCCQKVDYPDHCGCNVGLNTNVLEDARRIVPWKWEQDNKGSFSKTLSDLLHGIPTQNLWRHLVENHCSYRWRWPWQACATKNVILLVRQPTNDINMSQDGRCFSLQLVLRKSSDENSRAFVKLDWPASQHSHSLKVHSELFSFWARFEFSSF